MGKEADFHSGGRVSRARLQLNFFGIPPEKIGFSARAVPAEVAASIPISFSKSIALSLQKILEHSFFWLKDFYIIKILHQFLKMCGKI